MGAWLIAVLLWQLFIIAPLENLCCYYILCTCNTEDNTHCMVIFSLCSTHAHYLIKVTVREFMGDSFHQLYADYQLLLAP